MFTYDPAVLGAIVLRTLLETDGTISVIRRAREDGGERFIKSRKRLQHHHRANS